MKYRFKIFHLLLIAHISSNTIPKNPPRKLENIAMRRFYLKIETTEIEIGTLRSIIITI